TAYREGGWTFEALAEAWPTTFAGAHQSVGERFPELPEEFREPASQLDAVGPRTPDSLAK
ncbi:MAG: hypothetical protein IRY85_22305, partial [Micromonosporaceae bacterium]|nr:hypothetical protein [Micromonosporaceae bacterium]